MERQGGHLRLRYCLTGRVLSLVKFGLDPKAGGRSRTADQVDNGLKCAQWFASPILRDVAEQAVLNLVPLAGPRREMADVDAKTCFVSELLQSMLPGARAIPVATARIGSDEQLASLGVAALPHLVPPPS